MTGRSCGCPAGWRRGQLSRTPGACPPGEAWPWPSPCSLSASSNRGDGRLAPFGANLKPGPKAVQIAAAASNQLASAKTLERMKPVKDAPKTKERIRRGEAGAARWPAQPGHRRCDAGWPGRPISDADHVAVTQGERGRRGAGS
jgi:hypothetical protein